MNSLYSRLVQWRCAGGKEPTPDNSIDARPLLSVTSEAVPEILLLRGPSSSLRTSTTFGSLANAGAAAQTSVCTCRDVLTRG